jgi:hypothetical protein
VSHFVQGLDKFVRADDPKHIEPAQRIKRHQALSWGGLGGSLPGRDFRGGKCSIAHHGILPWPTNGFNSKTSERFISFFQTKGRKAIYPCRTC